MSSDSGLLELRIKLDQAITYGTPHEARMIAVQGLKEAEGRILPGEIEYFKGQLDLINENFTVAIEHFDKAIKYNSTDAAAFNDRALCMVELGIIDEAFVYFDKGISAEPDYATVYHNKGWLLNNIGRHKEAVECFRKALELEPDRAVTYDNLADALLNLNDCAGALAAYRKVLELLQPGQCMEIRNQVAEQIKFIEAKLSGNKGGSGKCQ